MASPGRSAMRNIIMYEPTNPGDDTGETKIEIPTESIRRPRLAVRLVGLVLVIFSVVVATYLLVAYFAFESGRNERLQQESTTRAEQLSRQIQLAREDLAVGSDNLALTRLEWILAQDPQNQEALALRERITTATSPAPAPTESPATVEAEAQDIPVSDDEALAELQAIRRMVSSEQWEGALSRLLAFRLQYPDYERGKTDQLLYDIYIALGLKFVNSEKIELGLNYFSHAERLGDLPQEARDYRIWADLYFQAVAYSGVNWEIASGYWRDLCAAAPFFKNSCERLNSALEGYGDQLTYLLDWCPAVSIYQEAWNRQPTQRLEGKINQAREGCASATPVPISGTLPLTGTAPITDTPPLESGD